MLNVTEHAAGKIKDLLEREDRDDFGLRMRVVGGGCSGLQYKLEFSEEPDGDIDVVESHGVRVFVDMKSALYLAGSELDFHGTQGQSKVDQVATDGGKDALGFVKALLGEVLEPMIDETDIRRGAGLTGVFCGSLCVIQGEEGELDLETGEVVVAFLR